MCSSFINMSLRSFLKILWTGKDHLMLSPGYTNMLLPQFFCLFFLVFWHTPIPPSWWMPSNRRSSSFIEAFWAFRFLQLSYHLKNCPQHHRHNIYCQHTTCVPNPLWQTNREHTAKKKSYLSLPHLTSSASYTVKEHISAAMGLPQPPPHTFLLFLKSQGHTSACSKQRHIHSYL